MRNVDDVAVSLLFFSSLSLLFLEERAHTHTRPPEAAKPSQALLRKE
jgi:hypothetical protein